MTVYLNGLVLGLSLIMALGPQNIFLIRQGALRRHAVLSVVICFFSDVILVISSVVGLHSLLDLHPQLQVWMTWLGAAFLIFYGLKTLKASFKESGINEEAEHQLLNRWQIILFALGFSLLNPHAIIDSVILIGGGSTLYPDQQRESLLGVISSSLLWFTALTSITYYFSHVLTRSVVWKRIELCSGMIMLYLSFKLIQRALS